MEYVKLNTGLIISQNILLVQNQSYFYRNGQKVIDFLQIALKKAVNDIKKEKKNRIQKSLIKWKGQEETLKEVIKKREHRRRMGVITMIMIIALKYEKMYNICFK